MQPTRRVYPDTTRMAPWHDPSGRGCALAGRLADGHDVSVTDVCRPCYLAATRCRSCGYHAGQHAEWCTD